MKLMWWCLEALAKHVYRTVHGLKISVSKSCVLGTVALGIIGCSTLLSTQLQAQDEEELSAQEFIAGNILLTLYHEAGHAFVSMYNLRLSENEEDAVDHFSIIALTEELNEGNLREEREIQLDNYLFSTALYWLAMSEDESFEDSSEGQEHALDSERFLQHLCMVYGSDPDVYVDLPADFDVADLVTPDCVGEYEDKTDEWYDMLASHWLGDRIRTDRIVIVEDKPDPRYKGYREWLHVHGILDEFESYVEGNFYLPRKITLRLMSCGEANAFWDPESFEIILCDEQIAEYSHIYDRLAEENG